MSDDRAPEKSDDDNRYKAVQTKLTRLAKAMDGAMLELEALNRHMQANASRTQDAASDIRNAELDTKYVELTNEVAVALGGAAVETRRLDETARETTDRTYEAKKKHSTLYGALDEVRSNRRERTPKPGFFAR